MNQARRFHHLPGRVPAGPSLAADRWHGARAVLPASQPFSDAPRRSEEPRDVREEFRAMLRGPAGPGKGLALKTARDISDGTLLPAERPPELPARLHSLSHPPADGGGHPAPVGRGRPARGHARRPLLADARRVQPAEDDEQP